MINNMFKKIFVVGLSIILAQELRAEGILETQLPIDKFLVFILLGVSILLLVLVYMIWLSFQKIYQIELSKLGTNKEADPKTYIEIEKSKRTFWEKFFGLNPKNLERDMILHHNYDGIEELDNPTPTWFMALFYGTIIFGVIYLFNYHFLKLNPLQEKEYAIEMENGEKIKQAYLAEVSSKINENNVSLLTDQASIDEGKSLFVSFNCGSCHGGIGEGKQGLGPNLTDEYWLHGGKPENVFKTIKYGVPSKGMIAWESKMNPLQMQKLTSYILSLQGSNPPNAREPQGEKMTTESAPTDSTLNNK